MMDKDHQLIWEAFQQGHREELTVSDDTVRNIGNMIFNKRPPDGYEGVHQLIPPHELAAVILLHDIAKPAFTPFLIVHSESVRSAFKFWIYPGQPKAVIAGWGLPESTDYITIAATAEDVRNKVYKISGAE
jgi:hypothetical protein